jgi:glucosamine-6-phosphate deaminase
MIDAPAATINVTSASIPPMLLEVLPDSAAVAHRAADVIAGVVAEKPDAHLGLPTGNTPLATYAELARRVAAGTADLSRAIIYAIDEFVGSARTTPGTNSAFYRAHVQLRQRALHCPNPSARGPQEHIAAFTDAIRRSGGLDLCVLGIGVNGHIAFNEPGSALNSRARVVELAPVVARAIEDAPGPEVPASWLQLHAAVSWLLDADAASALRSR